MARAAEGAHLASASPVLVAACKTQGETAILAAITAGVTEFGENRVQEAETKWPALKKTHPQILLHLIGSLQSNKAEEAVALFDVIETVDRPKLAEALAKAMEKQAGAPNASSKSIRARKIRRAACRPGRPTL